MTDAAFPVSMQAADWLHLFLHYLVLSLLSVGGAISSAPDMHRYLVEQQRWLTDAQFNSSISMAQAAPGPNVLFVALLGWNIGINSGGYLAGLFGVLVTMTAIMLPSSLLTYLTAQWGHRNRDLRIVRAFKQGMAPIVIALLVATAWILATSTMPAGAHWPKWLLIAGTVLVIWRTRIHLLWLLAAGAILGAIGLV